ncbi:UDP-galactose translocator [Echinococcus granulosus]|uniref:UDP-galactose translocator n=1 Tax=Echinococcus granulosus TaxID=6210 RepID=W6UWG2_ECHGR|nr:UDP-galactose translocator [Echinococcus granulosus]EUB64956.1 UDP-galactose translocator [Echinococcus granulosus]
MPGSKWAKIGYLVILSFQNVLHTLAMRYSRAEYRIRYSASSVVILSEIMKFSISSLVLFHEGLFKRAISGIYYDTCDFLRTCVPALIYVVQNNTIIFALSCLDATVFQVTYQLKLLTTTIFSVLFLRKSISFLQWISQIVLFIGVAVVQLQDHVAQSSTPTPHDASGAAGLMAVLFASVLSGFAAVYFERILKHSPKSLWTRNFELSLASIAIALVGQAVGEGGRVSEKGFFYGFDWLVWTTVALQSVGGILVALVVKHADNILKVGAAIFSYLLLLCVWSISQDKASDSASILSTRFCVFSLISDHLYRLFCLLRLQFLLDFPLRHHLRGSRCLPLLTLPRAALLAPPPPHLLLARVHALIFSRKRSLLPYFTFDKTRKTPVGNDLVTALHELDAENPTGSAPLARILVPVYIMSELQVVTALPLLLLLVQPGQNYSVPLSGHWRLSDGDSIVHFNLTSTGTDAYSVLQEIGSISDPLSGYGDKELRYISYKNWTFSHYFWVEYPEVLKTTSLELDELDTFCCIYLNNRLLACTENSFIRTILPIDSVLCRGWNFLQLVFKPTPLMAKEAYRKLSPNPPLPACWPDIFRGECYVNAVRTTQAAFGWDWGPAFPIQGFWKLPFLRFGEVWLGDGLRFFPVMIKRGWKTTVSVEVLRSSSIVRTDQCVCIHVKLGGGLMHEWTERCISPRHRETNVWLELPLASNVTVRPWWPLGVQAGPHLYALKVQLRNPLGGPPIDRKSFWVGFREVKLVQLGAKSVENIAKRD